MSKYKGKKVKVKVAQSCPTFCGTTVCSLPGSSVHGDSPGKKTGVGFHALLQGSSNSGTKPRSPALQADSLPSEPPGKSKNTGVCSQSLLQGNFLHQELNQGLLCLGMKAHPKTQMASSGMALNTDGIRFLCQLIGSCSPVPHIS